MRKDAPGNVTWCRKLLVVLNIVTVPAHLIQSHHQNKCVLLMVMDTTTSPHLVGNHFLVTFHVLGAGRVYVAICQVM